MKKRGERWKGREREGEGRRRRERSCVLDNSDGQRASIRRTGSEVSLEGNLCSSWSNVVHDVASKRYVFLMENSTFHLSKTLMLAGFLISEFFRFSSFQKHHFFPEENDRVLKNEN